MSEFVKEYEVKIVVKPVTGYKITVEDATIDGEAVDSVVLGTDGKLVINKTYPATNALVDFALTVEDAVIDVADGTVKLVPVFTPAVEGTVIDVTTVKWEIISNGPEGKSATIDENGVVTAVYDGEVVVRATSDYNPEVTAEATVSITNQIASYKVTFNKNTTSTVSNMPESVEIKGEYVLPNQIPVREGFSFAGWAKSETDIVTVSKDVITDHTTYYALWVRGFHHEFFEEGEVVGGGFSAVENIVYDYEAGVVSFTAKPSSYNSMDMVMTCQKADKSTLFKGSDYSKIAIRVMSDKSSNATHKIYYTSKDKATGGKDLVPSFSESYRVTHKQAINAGEYTEIVIDMSSEAGWMDGYITSFRIDLLDSGADTSYFGSNYTVDYIRAVSYETGVVEITGIDKPVAKAVADTDAVSKDPSKYTVTNVSWEGGLLYDYYYGGETEYTVCVTVKGAPGYFVSDAPSKATINGIETKNFEYNTETGELTLKYTFPATSVIENSTAFNLDLVAKDDSGMDVYETRKLFEGEEFALGTYMPTSVPAGMRWIGWSETAGSTENTAGNTVKVDADKTYYAVYENLVEFDYSNYYHTFGTKANNNGTLEFKGGLATVTAVGSYHTFHEYQW